MWHWGCCDLCPVSAVLIALCYANRKLGLITLSQTVRETKYPVTSGYLLGHSSFSFDSCNDLISTLRVLLLVLIRLRKSSACCRCATCTIWSRISIFCSSFVKPNCGKLACMYMCWRPSARSCSLLRHSRNSPPSYRSVQCSPSLTLWLFKHQDMKTMRECFCSPTHS